MKKIPLFWWRVKPNFGDACSAYIVSYLFGEVRWTQNKSFIILILRSFKNMLLHGKPFNLDLIRGIIFPWQKVVFGVGSILNRSNGQTLIWGSGFREYEDEFKGGWVYAIRGKLSLEKIPRQNLVAQEGGRKVAIGDPALLLPRIYTPSNHNCTEDTKYKVSIIPHFTEYDYFYHKYSSRYNVIDIRTTDVEGIIDAIYSSQYILSTSLHGLIVSHAYGMPALWIKHGFILSSDFKFKDYFSGVGIPDYEAFTNYDEILNDFNYLESLFEKHKDLYSIKDITSIQDSLIKSFPVL